VRGTQWSPSCEKRGASGSIPQQVTRYIKEKRGEHISGPANIYLGEGGEDKMMIKRDQGKLRPVKHEKRNA